jgi:hypothetical protein
MPVAGIGTSFKLDNVSAVLTDISTWLTSVQSSSDTDRLDGTAFQPNVAVPVKTEVPGFSTKSYSLSGLWSPTVEVHFSAIEGRQGLNYQHGPQGTTVGQTKISGLCSCFSYSGPQGEVGSLQTFTAELSVVSRTVGVF